MLKTTLLAAAALVALGATAAHAGGGGHGHKNYGHGGYQHHYAPRPFAGRYRHHRGRERTWRGYPYGRNWFDYRGRPYCHYAPRKVPIKVWDRRGNPYRKWVWKDVRVCV